VQKAAPTDWFTTTRQALPEFFRLARRLRPTFHMPDIRGIDHDFLREQHVAALIWDVDGTLMPHHYKGVAPSLQPTVDRILQLSEVRHAILSNCGEERLLELGQLFPRIPVIKVYESELGTVCRTLLSGRDEWRIGSRLIDPPEQRQPVKKPSRKLVDCAMQVIGCEDRSGVVMVGDQYFTDIAGANLAGIRSIKVDTFDPRSFPFVLRSFQRIESLLYRLFYR
jgi:predicted HAD superfamily phosphohydrolase YqeG